MKCFVILLILVGFSGNIFAQNFGDGPDDIWTPACLKESNTECDRSSLFHDAISRPFAQSDSVAVGTIIQKEKQEQNSIKYSINVNFYLKNYQPFDLLTATLINATEPQTWPEVLYYNSPVFNEGDLVFVYLKKSDGQYNILPESFALDKQEARGPPPTILLTKSPSEDNFKQGDKILVSGEVRKMELVKATKDGEQLDVKLDLHDENNQVIFSDLIDIDVDGSYNYDFQTSAIPPGKYELEVNYGPSTTGNRITIEFNPIYWTPLKQFESGIPIDEIRCKDNHVLVTKSSDGSPACVNPLSVPKLTDRSWGTIYIDKTMAVQGVEHAIRYKIAGDAAITSTIFSEETSSIVIKIDSKTTGNLIVELPRTLLDSGHTNCDVKYSDMDTEFVVLADKEEIQFYEIANTTQNRILLIPFKENSAEIEIVSMCLI